MPSPFPNAPAAQRGTIHRLNHVSTSLSNNPWNDPVQRDLWVYEPVNANQAALPCIFILPAFAGTGESLLARGLTDIPMSTRLDLLHASGCPPFIAVMPDSMTSVGGSQYLNSPGIGNYATYVAEELRATVQDSFHTTGQWGVIGRSSGGFGALHLAMTYPELFQAVGCHAGDMGFDLMFLGEIGLAVQGFASFGGRGRFLERFWATHRPNHAQFAAFNLLAMAYAYQTTPVDPNTGPQLPVDLETGAFKFDVLKDWMRFDPIVRIQESSVQEALKKLRCLYIDVGNRDEYQLHLGARRLKDALAAADIDFIYEEFEGGHRGTAYRFDHSLPILAAALHNTD